MIYAITIIAAFVSAILRRIHGGWLGLRGSVARGIIIAFTAAPLVYWAYTTNCFWFYDCGKPFQLLRYATAMVVLALVWLHWVLPCNFTNILNSAIAPIWRYSYCTILLFAVTLHYEFLVVGPLVGLAYIAAMKWGGPVTTFLDTPTMRPLDGWEAWGELSLGFISGFATWSILW